MNLKPGQHEQIFCDKFSMIILFTCVREKIFPNVMRQMRLLEDGCVSIYVAMKNYDM